MCLTLKTAKTDCNRRKNGQVHILSALLYSLARFHLLNHSIAHLRNAIGKIEDPIIVSYDQNGPVRSEGDLAQKLHDMMARWPVQSMMSAHRK